MKKILMIVVLMMAVLSANYALEKKEYHYHYQDYVGDVEIYYNGLIENEIWTYEQVKEYFEGQDDIIIVLRDCNTLPEGAHEILMRHGFIQVDFTETYYKDTLEIEEYLLYYFYAGNGKAFFTEKKIR